MRFFRALICHHGAKKIYTRTVTTTKQAYKITKQAYNNIVTGL